MTGALCCPDCRRPLSERGESLVCAGCARSYPLLDQIPSIIGAGSVLDESEVETQEYVSDFYEDLRYARPWSRAYHAHALGQMLELAPPRGEVLDLGCGNGVFLDHLVERAGAGVGYTGLDVSRKMLGHARRRLEAAVGSAERRGAPRPALRLVHGDACRLPFADGAFDVVFARGLLHHLPDPAAGVREIGRVLRPGGLAAVLDPNRTFVSDLPRRLARKGKHFDEAHKNFALSELEGLLGLALRIERVRFVGYLAYPLLGFPDLVDFGRYVPLGRLGPALTRLDDLIARLPLVGKLAWGVMIAASKA